MKILVTGATGYLGSHLVESLLKNGYEVVILKRSFSDTKRIRELLPHIQYYDIDVTPLELSFKENKIETIIHTATNYGRNNENINQLFEANVSFPIKLLELATYYKVDNFINTDSFFGKENYRYKYLQEYILSKKHFLEWGKVVSETKKIQFINTRLEHIYGPLDSEFKFINYVIRNCLRHVEELNLTYGEQRRDFIYIEDAVSAFLIIIKKIKNLSKNFLEFEIGNGETYSLRYVVEKIHQITRSKTKLNFGAIPYRKNEIMESKANLQSIKKLGWNYIYNIEDGLIKTIDREKTQNLYS